jgi:hypothetical protein
MQDQFNLFRKDSARVTYAAVFLPSPENPDQEIKYLLPKGIRGAAGFEEYNQDKHHRDMGLGVLCCGNCYEQGKQVPVHHRKPTDERVGGGDKPGTHATFAAYPHTIDEHDEECKKRRTASGRAEQTQDIRWNINIPATYHGYEPPEKVKNNRLAGRTSKVISENLSEMLKPAARMTREQAQNAMFVVDGQVTDHKDMLIDGDNWARMIKPHAYKNGLYRLFHVNNPSAVNLRNFADAAAGLSSKETKISCTQYELVDEYGKKHIIQPSIHTTSDDVRALFEKNGDFMVLAPSRHVPFQSKSKGGAIIHQLMIFVDDPSLVVELYQDQSRKVSDYNAVHNLRLPMQDVHVIEPPKRAIPSKIKTVPEGQISLFGDMADPSQNSPAPH